MNILLHVRERSIDRLDRAIQHVWTIFCAAMLRLTDKPASIDALEENIEPFIPELPAEMLERASQNWTKRMDHLKRSRGQHLHEKIFKL